MTKYNKALAALGTAIIAVAAAFGLHLSPELITGVEGIVGTVLVYLVPNTSGASDAPTPTAVVQNAVTATKTAGEVAAAQKKCV